MFAAKTLHRLTMLVHETATVFRLEPANMRYDGSRVVVDVIGDSMQLDALVKTLRVQGVLTFAHPSLGRDTLVFAFDEITTLALEHAWRIGDLLRIDARVESGVGDIDSGRWVKCEPVEITVTAIALAKRGAWTHGLMALVPCQLTRNRRSTPDEPPRDAWKVTVATIDGRSRDVIVPFERVDVDNPFVDVTDPVLVGMVETVPFETPVGQSLLIALGNKKVA